MISSSAPPSVVPAAGSAAAALTDAPPRMAATAYEIFERMADSPQRTRWIRRSDATLRACDRTHAHLLEHPRTRGVAVDAALRLQAARRGRQAICILELS